MTDLLFRHIPEEHHAKLKQSARAHRRSMNQEIIVLLEQSLAEDRPLTPLPVPQPLLRAVPQRCMTMRDFVAAAPDSPGD